MTDRDRVDVLGVRFDRLSRAEAARAVVELAQSGGKHYVVKPYSEFMPPAHKDPDVRALLNGASLTLADGIGVLWAAHYLSLPGSGVRACWQLLGSLASLIVRPGALRDPLPQAMHGVDFTWLMLEEIERAGLSVFLLGGTKKEAQGAVTAIRERLPGLQIVGVHEGHLRGDGDDVAEVINQSGADILLVAMGFPRQERWIARNLARLNVRVAVAEGGSFSFMSGAVSRSPRWMRKTGLEWLYRLVRQPWRLRRQLALPVFVWLVFRERINYRRDEPE